ncbi:MAG: acyl carrier protein [Lachnospiraceae bacterium]|nr:acyl carrier protein [Lachnospiraceae bacterium]
MTEKLIEIVADYLGKDVKEISTTETFLEMGLDSLDLMDLVMQIEEAFEVKLEMNQEINCIEKLASYIEEIKA